MEKELKIDELTVRIYANQSAMAKAVTEDVHAYIAAKLQAQDSLAAILATGNSQIEFLKALNQKGGIDWGKATLFHMDEYLGITSDHKASFQRYMRERVAEPMNPKVFNYINGLCDLPIEECQRYADLLAAQPIDLCCMGVGENGHLAFNDPHVADFEAKEALRIVRLDDECKMQQVKEGHFASLETVPPYAFTLTIPTLCSAEKVFCVAPETRKAKAIQAALAGPISTACPASFLRTKSNATLYLDNDSAALLDV